MTYQPNLWQANTPQKFWLLNSPISEKQWHTAIINAFPLLQMDLDDKSLDNILHQTLGEGRFGRDHWTLSSTKKLYYLVKPAIPRLLTKLLRKVYRNPMGSKVKNNWPIDDRYVLFMWEILSYLLSTSKDKFLEFHPLWPQNSRYAFVLTHDIETHKGQSFVRNVAALEEKFGFRSSFNFVLERYTLDYKLIMELKERGFEVGCHGLKHDGKLFNSKKIFSKRAASINKLVKKLGMNGFRAPLTHRNPFWMQDLEIEYDLSFFDTDPFEPIPGGAMSIWPYFLGHFVELPYTLVQDYTLASVLGEKTPKLWLEKVDFIERYHGMALLNSHPDYLKEDNVWDVYTQFLEEMQKRTGYWHALPHEVAKWWNTRSNTAILNTVESQIDFAQARLQDGKLELSSQKPNA